METYCGEKRFEYWDDAEVVLINDADELIEKYTEQDGEHHYFDSDTMEFFGTENFQMVAPGISAEYQANAPDGVDRWTIVSWVWNESGTMFTPYTLCRHDNLIEAAICGHYSYEELSKDTPACFMHGYMRDPHCRQCDSF